MKIAIVGNRTGWSEKEVHSKLDDYFQSTMFHTFPKDVNEEDVEFVSGGAEGVDTFAQTFAKKCGMKITIIYPNPDKPSPERYHERNQKVVDMADMLIAFNHSPRSGTHSTINRADKKGIDVIVVNSEIRKNNE